MFCLFCLSGCNNQVNAISEKLELGQKYLNEMDYEEAIVAFQKVISLEPNNKLAYIGMGDAYIGLKQYEQAIDSYGEAIQIDQTDTLVYEKRADAYLNFSEQSTDRKEEYEKLAAQDYEMVLELGAVTEKVCQKLINVYLKMKNLDKISDCLKYISDDFTNEAFRKEIKEITETLNFIEKLSAACDSDDINQVSELMQSTGYQYFKGLAKKFGYPMIKSINNKRLGLYDVEMETFGSNMVYYGDFVGTQREGNGYWLGCYKKNFYAAEGIWLKDKPEGKQEVREWDEALNKDINQRHVYGNTVQGLWNGEVVWGFEKNDGTSEQWKTSFDQGLWNVISTEKQEQNTYYIVSEKIVDGKRRSMRINNLDILEGIVGFNHEKVQNIVTTEQSELNEVASTEVTSTEVTETEMSVTEGASTELVTTEVVDTEVDATEMNNVEISTVEVETTPANESTVAVEQENLQNQESLDVPNIQVRMRDSIQEETYRDNGWRSFVFKLDMPEITIENYPEAQAKINTYLDQIISDKLNEKEKLQYSAEDGELAELMRQDEDEYEWWVESNTTGAVLTGHKQAVSIWIGENKYLGGPRGEQAVLLKSFDSTNGNEITLSSMSDNESQFRGFILDKISKTLKERDMMQYVDSGRLTEATIKNYCLDRGSLRIIFNPGDIIDKNNEFASQDFYISYEECAPYLNQYGERVFQW